MHYKAIYVISVLSFFSIVGISLFLVNSAGALQSGDETFKLTYDLIVSDTTGTGIAYTPQCFECHLPINFSYSGASAPDTKTLALSDFSHTFNKFNQNDTKRWAINYVTAGENFTSTQNITPSLYALEMSDMTSADIRIRVSTFINETK